MTLVGAYGIRGLAFWHVSGEDRRQWPALRSYAVQRGTTVTASGPAAVTYGATATISGTVRATTSGAALKGVSVRLQDRALGSGTWATRATGTSSATGAVSFATKPTANREYRLVTGATWTYRAGSSPTITTMVRWRVTAKLADSTVRRGDRITLRGTVAPARVGTVVQRQRLVEGTWATVARGKTGKTGTYAFTFTWPTAGSYTYRVRVPATKANATATSRAVAVTVS
jgi:hypothetical protein